MFVDESNACVCGKGSVLRLGSVSVYAEAGIRYYIIEMLALTNDDRVRAYAVFLHLQVLLQAHYYSADLSSLPISLLATAHMYAVPVDTTVYRQIFSVCPRILMNANRTAFYQRRRSQISNYSDNLTSYTAPIVSCSKNKARAYTRKRCIIAGESVFGDL